MNTTSALLLAALTLPCLSGWAAAGTGISLVHAFSQAESPFPSPVVNTDGASPAAAMILATNGNSWSLYGTTPSGGASGSNPGAGIIFNLSPAGLLTDLYDFQGIPESGTTNYNIGPNQLTAGPKGFFYGTTWSGGTNGSGTIFERAPSGGVADLYVFSALGTDDLATNSDGANPTGALAPGTNGSFYGTTQYGGASGNGTIFQVQLSPAKAFINVYSFSAENADGTTPNGLVLGTDGNFYGTTQYGGANGAGTFFQFTASGALTTLYSFGETTNDAASPAAALVQYSDGNFYGTSQYGGTNFIGTIFKITPSGAETVLYSFSGGNDGGIPNTALTLGTDGNFYGTTGGGGVNGNGTLFKITPAGAFSSLYSFAAVNASLENSIGAQPAAALAVGLDGNLYGSCVTGGAYGNGTIFRYTSAAFSSPVQPPLITTQPSSKSGLAGTTVTVSLAAKGAMPLVFQWLKNKTNVLSDGGDISGSATSALILGPLRAGDAGSYSVLVTNIYGVTNSAVAVLSVKTDTTHPGVKIISPAANARTNSPVFAGTASDNALVTNVFYWLTNFNGGPLLSGTALLGPGGTNWSIPAVTPFPGSNVLAAQSVDFSGLKSPIMPQAFFYKVTNSLAVFQGGDGAGSFIGTASVKNDPVPADGAGLNIGERYSIQAVPGRNSLFSNWVGSSAVGAFTSNGAVLNFVMQSNLVLTANFETNFFLAAHGTYNGLFFNTNSVAAESSGMIEGLLLATNGTFTAQLWKAGTFYSLPGRFDVSGNCSNSVGPASAAGGPLRIHLTVDRAARLIVGTVSNTLWSANVTAEPAGTNLPSAQYTLLFAPPAGAPANTPPGDGYAQVTNHLGMVTVKGALADSAAFTAQTVAESQNGDFPIYATPYGNTGLLLGWINLTNLEADPPANSLAWIKKASRTYPPYTNGFTNTLQVQGALWTNPLPKTPAVVLPEGQLVITNNARLDLTFNVSVVNTNLVKLGLQPTNLLTGSIAPKTGLFTLPFGNGSGKSTTTGSGAFLQNQSIGGGFFTGTTNAGSIIITPAATNPN